MTKEPFRPPHDPDDSVAREWEKLSLYRWLIAGGAAMLCVVPFFHGASFKNGFLIAAVLVGGLGLTQAISFTCPACGDRFSRMALSGAKLLFVGVWSIPFEAGRILLKPECQSCHTKVGEHGTH